MHGFEKIPGTKPFISIVKCGLHCGKFRCCMKRKIVDVKGYIGMFPAF